MNIIPEEYVIEKFYTFGYQPKQNRYNKTFQCGCPICREGKSLGSKRRCFYIPKNNNIFCHNCGWSSTPLKWVEKVSGLSYHDIIKEVGKYEYGFVSDVHDTEIKKEYTTPDLPVDAINLFDKQQLEFYKDNETVKSCVKLITDRHIDVAVNRPKAIYTSLTDYVHKNRLIIPFYDERDKVVFYQSRTVLQTNHSTYPKYTSKLGSDKSLYGINNVNDSLNYVFLFEGPINAMFAQNGLAVAGISKGDHNFTQLQQEQLKLYQFYTKIWVLDSQWIDKTSFIKTAKLLKQGERVFMWPEKYGKTFKDFNDMCMAYNLQEISTNFIIENSFTQLTGTLKLAEIKKAYKN